MVLKTIKKRTSVFISQTTEDVIHNYVVMLVKYDTFRQYVHKIT